MTYQEEEPAINYTLPISNFPLPLGLELPKPVFMIEGGAQRLQLAGTNLVIAILVGFE